MGEEGYKPCGNMLTGICGERFTVSVFSTLKLPIKHNPFDHTYGSFVGHGADIEGIGPLKGLVQIEVKNLNGRWRITKDWLKREVTGGYIDGKFYKPRFTPGCKNKILVMFGGSYISQPLRNFIKFAHGIKLVEIPEQIMGYSKTMFKLLLDKLMFIKYLFKSKLKKYFSDLNSNIRNHIGRGLLGNVLGEVYTPPDNKIEFGTKCIKIRRLYPVQRNITRWSGVLS